MATLILMAGIGALTQSVFVPSMSGMATWFGVDYKVMQIAISGYLATTAVAQLVIGPLSDRFGRRPVVIFGLVLFLIGTLGAILAPNATVFLLFRMLQSGVAAALVLSRAIVRDMVPEREAAAMIGYVTMCMAAIPMAGPMIGGALDTVFGWRASFVLLFVSGMALLVLCILDQGETAPLKGGGLRQQMRSYPLLLGSGRFWGYALVAAFGSAGFPILTAGASFIAHSIFGLSSFQAGIGLGVPALGYAAGNFLSGRMTMRFGIDRMIITGLIVAMGSVTFALAFALAGDRHPLIFYGALVIQGLGIGMLLPSATAGLLSVRPELAGTASGLGAALMMACGAVAAALSGFFLDAERGAAPLLLMVLVVNAFAWAGLSIATRDRRRFGL
ncbi:MAG: multidrug effflux MFS transporter [Paracoccus sp. (in: a-proteobacteria)]|uniref:multidrug effflux MFS transporter n=1 Tax=Paracoccus sp. TaxID=267 RepID=UPI0039E664B9